MSGVAHPTQSTSLKACQRNSVKWGIGSNPGEKKYSPYCQSRVGLGFGVSNSTHSVPTSLPKHPFPFPFVHETNGITDAALDSSLSLMRSIQL